MKAETASPLPASITEYHKLKKELEKLPVEEARVVTRLLCKIDLWWLLRFVLSTRLIPADAVDPTHCLGECAFDHPWLFDRCREVQANPNGYLDVWAREHFKTTIISFGLTIFDIIRNPEVTVGLFSHTKPMAKRILFQIQQELQTNEMLKELFPDVIWADPQRESPKWSLDQGILVKRLTNPTANTVEAWGLVDGQPIGKHFSVRIYDDVVTEESVFTAEMREKTSKAWELSLNLGTQTGVSRYIGTRYHFNDLYHDVETRSIATPRIYPAFEPASFEDGVPVLQTAAYLAEKVKGMTRTTAYAQLLCNPLSGDDTGFKEKDIRYYNDLPFEIRKGLNVYILVDPANSKKKYSDYTAIWVVGLGSDGNYYVLEFLRDRLNLAERVELLFQLHKRWKPIEVRYEQYALMADIEHIDYVQNNRNYRFEVTRVGGKVKKEDRIRRLIPLFQEHKIYLPVRMEMRNTSGQTEDFVKTFVNEEFKAFPVGAHDDLMDALARICEPDLELLWPLPDQYWEETLGQDSWKKALHKEQLTISWAGA